MKMEETIKSICRGNAFIAENCGMDNEEIKKLTAMQIEESQLWETFTKKQKALFEKNEEISLDISNHICEEYFEKGFRLGMQIAIEVLMKK